MRATLKSVNHTPLTQRPLKRASLWGGIGVLALSFSLSVLSVLSVLNGVSAAPPIDASASWGEGAHLISVQPARLSREGSAGVSYDIMSSLEGKERSHQLAASFEVSERLALGVGALWWDAQAPLGSLTLSELGLSSAMSLQMGAQLTLTPQLTTGFALSRDSMTRLGASPGSATSWRTDLGVSYEPSAWVRLGATLSGLGSAPAIAPELSARAPLERPRLATLSLALRPLERLRVGGAFTPREGGGRWSASLSVRLWRGLALELGASAPLSAALNAETLSLERAGEEGVSLALALAWTGSAGWRVGASNAQGGAQGGASPLINASARLSEAPPHRELSPSPQLTLISMSGASEVSSSPSLLSEAKTSAPFIETLRALESLKRRGEVKALMFVLNAPQLGWAQAEELAHALRALKESGREVLLYCPHLTPESYVVASEAHEVWVSPTSELMISGLLQERFYVKGLLERLNIKAEFIAVGDYKSAPEMFTREGPSDQAQEANDALLQARYSLLKAALMRRASAQGAQGAEEETQRAEGWLKEGPYSAQEALKVGLVNRVVNAVSLEHTLRASRPQLTLTAHQPEGRGGAWGPTPQLAALFIEGEIGGGRLGGGARAATLVPLIRDLTYDEQVKGVLLRVDSPGGAISDADELWRALSELAKRKPLVASMGNLAASGGYYVAAPALKIFASPNTLTGSIGVFAGKVDLSPLLAALGVQVHRSRLGEGGGEQSLFTPWSEAQRTRLKRSMEQMYGLFLDRVTAGRPELTRERLLPLAGGRVWTGEAARERGLVDVEGGALDALAYLAHCADLEGAPYELKVVAPSPPSLLSQASRLTGRVFGSADLQESRQESRQESTQELTSLLTQLERAPLPPPLKALLRLTLAHPSQALAYLPFW